MKLQAHQKRTKLYCSHPLCLVRETHVASGSYHVHPYILVGFEFTLTLTTFGLHSPPAIETGCARSNVNWRTAVPHRIEVCSGTATDGTNNSQVLRIRCWSI